MKTSSILVAACVVGSMWSTSFAQSLSERLQHVQQKKDADRSATSKAAMLGALMYTDLTVDFKDTPARDAINYIKTQLGIDIVGRFSDDRTGAGIDPEARINLQATDRPALNVLEMVLDQCEDTESCTWQLRNGFVEVGTKDRLNAAAAREIRYYPIRDLLFEAPRFDNAPEFDIEAAINQGNQGGGGGGGSGGGFGGGGSGGGGFGGGSGGGGSGGGSLIGGGDNEDIERVPESEKAQEIIDIIVESIEPEAWVDNGGEAASIRYWQGVLIVRAPDYVQRQIGGYPFAARPARAQAGAGRYVTFSGSFSAVENVGFRQTDAGEFGGAAGN